MSLTQDLNNAYLNWEVKEDGIYLTVRPGCLNQLKLESIQSELAAKSIVNYDWKRISEVIQQEKNRPEFVGPVFKIYNREKDAYIIVESVPEEARIKIRAEHQQKFLKITAKDIEFKLKEYKIVHGIDWAIVSEMLSKDIFDRSITVARCTPASHGIDAKIEEKVEIDPDARPIELNNGRVDFKNIKNFRQIQEGEVIALRFPPVPGKSGIDVYGKPLEPISGSDKGLPAGTNTKILPDGKQLVAGVAGYLYRSQGNICVGELLCIDEDVSFKTGNIKYSGEVIIYGSVQSGFQVETKGDIYITGDVDASQITSRMGNITIEKGVYGKGKTILKGKLDIKLSRVQDTTIECEGHVYVSHSARNCIIKAGSVEFGPGCEVINNQVTAFDAIVGYSIGQKGTSNDFIIVDRESQELQFKHREYEKLEEKINQAIVPLETRIKGMNKMLKNMDVEASVKIKDEVRQVVMQYHTMKKKLEYVIEKKNLIKVEMEKPKEYLGKIQIIEKCFPGTKVTLYEKVMVIKDIMSRLEFLWGNDGVTTKSLKPSVK